MIPASYNDKTSLMICCPLTTKIKSYPFEVLVGDSAGSAVLADQVRNLDWRTRKATRKDRVSLGVLAKACAKNHAIIS